MRKPHAHTVLVCLGATITLIGGGIDGRLDRIDILTLGVLLTLAGLGEVALSRLGKPATAAYELGLQDGHREGFAEGRRIGRPTVVPLNAAHPDGIPSPPNVVSCARCPVAARKASVLAGAEQAGRIDSLEWTRGRDGVDSPL